MSVTTENVTGRLSGWARERINGLDIAKTCLVTGRFVEQKQYQIICALLIAKWFGIDK